MSVENFEIVLKHINDLISQREIQRSRFDLMCVVFYCYYFAAGGSGTA